MSGFPSATPGRYSCGLPVTLFFCTGFHFLALFSKLCECWEWMHVCFHVCQWSRSTLLVWKPFCFWMDLDRMVLPMHSLERSWPLAPILCPKPWIPCRVSHWVFMNLPPLRNYWLWLNSYRQAGRKTLFLRKELHMLSVWMITGLPRSSGEDLCCAHQAVHRLEMKATYVSMLQVRQVGALASSRILSRKCLHSHNASCELSHSLLSSQMPLIEYLLVSGRTRDVYAAAFQNRFSLYFCSWENKRFKWNDSPVSQSQGFLGSTDI